MYRPDVICEIERLASILGIEQDVNNDIVNQMNEKLMNCQDVRVEIYMTFIMHQLSKKKCHHPIPLLDIQMSHSTKYRSFNRMFRNKLGRKIIFAKLDHVKHVLKGSLSDKYAKNILRGNLLFIPSPNYLKYLSHRAVSECNI